MFGVNDVILVWCEFNKVYIGRALLVLVKHGLYLTSMLTSLNLLSSSSRISITCLHLRLAIIWEMLSPKSSNWCRANLARQEKHTLSGKVQLKSAEQVGKFLLQQDSSLTPVDVFEELYPNPAECNRLPISRPTLFSSWKCTTSVLHVKQHLILVDQKN